MTCIEHYIKDAESILVDLEFREKAAQVKAYLEYSAARTIQKWFRGYITRKHINYLNHCATTIQRFWRGLVDRKLYFTLLQEAVHIMYWKYYNQMATKIQKVWRGHFVRSNVFSYYKLKSYINNVLQKNKELLELAKELQCFDSTKNVKVNLKKLKIPEKNIKEVLLFPFLVIAEIKKYKEGTEREMKRKAEQECQELITFLSVKIHHLIRTHQIEGIYSKHGTLEYSAIEKHLKNLKLSDYRNTRHENGQFKHPQSLNQNYIFKGRMQECEKAWLHRNDPGKYSLATGEYGLDMKEHEKKQKMKGALSYQQNKPMAFGPVRYNDTEPKLNRTKYDCPPLHRTVK